MWVSEIPVWKLGFNSGVIQKSRQLNFEVRFENLAKARKLDDLFATINCISATLILITNNPYNNLNENH